MKKGAERLCPPRFAEAVPKQKLNDSMGNDSVLFGLTQSGAKHKSAGFHYSWLRNPAFSI